MKRLNLTIAALALTISLAAQVRIDAGMSIGGYNGTTLNYSARTGFTGGVYYDFKYSSFGDSNSGEYLSAGLQFTQTNYDSNQMEGSTSWLQLPVLTRTKCGLSENLYLYADAGMFGGYALNNKTTMTWSYDGRLVETDLSDCVRNFNFGIIGGVGLGYRSFSILVQWQRGVLNLMGKTPTIGNTPIFSTNNYCTNSWRLILSYSF